MFEHLYADEQANVRAEDQARDAERMQMCERWRAAGARPAERERWYLRQQQLLAGEPLQ